MGCGLPSKTQGLLLLLFFSMAINALLSVSLAFCIFAQEFSVQKHCFNTAVQGTHFGILDANNVSFQGGNILSERIKTIIERQNNLTTKCAMHSWQIGSKKLHSLDSWPSAIWQPLANVSAIEEQYYAIMELITPNDSIIVLMGYYNANIPIRSAKSENHHSKAEMGANTRSTAINARKSATSHKRPEDRLQRRRTFSEETYATNQWTYEAQMARSMKGDRFEVPLDKSRARRNYRDFCNRNVAPAATLPTNRSARIGHSQSSQSSLQQISAYVESSDSDIVAVDACYSEHSDGKRKTGQREKFNGHGHAANTRKVPTGDGSHSHGHAADSREVPTSQNILSHGHAANTRKVPAIQTLSGHGHAADTRTEPTNQETHSHGHAANTRKVPAEDETHGHGHAANKRKVPADANHTHTYSAWDIFERDWTSQTTQPQKTTGDARHKRDVYQRDDDDTFEEGRDPNKSADILSIQTECQIPVSDVASIVDSDSASLIDYTRENDHSENHIPDNIARWKPLDNMHAISTPEHATATESMLREQEEQRRTRILREKERKRAEALEQQRAQEELRTKTLAAEKEKQRQLALELRRAEEEK